MTRFFSIVVDVDREGLAKHAFDECYKQTACIDQLKDEDLMI